MLSNANTTLEKTTLPYKHDFLCIACGYNPNKGKIERTKIQRKELNFIKRLKNPTHKTIKTKNA